MTRRVVGHLIAFAVLVGTGLWIAYQAVMAPVRIGPLLVDVELAAIYWFAVLIYAFIVLMLYYPLRKRSWWVLLIGHAVAGALAIASTSIVVVLGYQNAALSTADGTTASSNDPAAQPLPLPPEKGAAPERQERFEGNQL